MRKGAFTLVEILCSVAIVASLMAILQPALAQAVGAAKRTVAVSNLHQLHLALKMYQVDHDGDGVYGPATKMGLPDFWWFFDPPDGPARHLPTTKGLWRSPCGTHPYRDIAPNATSDLTMYTTDLEEEYWPTYSVQYEEASMLVIDKNCADHSVPLSSPYRNKRLMGVRLNGSLAQVTTAETVELWPWHR